jgi:hypothetical protein
MRFVTPENRRQTPTDLNNWGPRFGFAYQFTPTSVFRGAYALMYSGSVCKRREPPAARERKDSEARRP